MKFKDLIILDVQENLDIQERDCNYINLSSGSINFTNSKKILIKAYLDKYYQIYKKKLIFNLRKKIKSSKIRFLEECEVFNLRNDKELFINKLIVILIIKKFILKKYKSVKIITDDYFTYKVFIKMNLNVDYLSKMRKKYDFSSLKILKFYIKTLIILALEKLTKKHKLNKNYENIYLSMYPNFYDNNKETFFKKKKDLKINFLLTDETHLNTKLKNVRNTLAKFNQKNTINLESFIHFSDIIKLILFLPYNVFNNFYNLNRELIIENCDFSDFFKYYINISLVNRFKLEIYVKSIARLKKKFPNIKNFHYYMFEYSFGFFLTNLFKNNFGNIQLTGYQHGIFSDNIMWLDLIKNNKSYLPHKIVALNKLCFKDYKNVTKISNIHLNKKKRKFKFSINLNKNSKKRNKILIFTGTHDARDIYNLVKNRKIKNDNNTYYLKFHPKIKINLTTNDQIRIIDKIKNQSFSKILISQTSTLVYDFINSNKKFNTIACDYRPSLTSSRFGKKYELVL